MICFQTKFIFRMAMNIGLCIATTAVAFPAIAAETSTSRQLAQNAAKGPVLYPFREMERSTQPAAESNDVELLAQNEKRRRSPNINAEGNPKKRKAKNASSRMRKATQKKSSGRKASKRYRNKDAEKQARKGRSKSQKSEGPNRGRYK